jgi:hypothetical protein
LNGAGAVTSLLMSCARRLTSVSIVSASINFDQPEPVAGVPPAVAPAGAFEAAGAFDAMAAALSYSGRWPTSLARASGKNASSTSGDHLGGRARFGFPAGSLAKVATAQHTANAAAMAET